MGSRVWSWKNWKCRIGRHDWFAEVAETKRGTVIIKHYRCARCSITEVPTWGGGS